MGHKNHYTKMLPLRGEILHSARERSTRHFQGGAISAFEAF